MSFLGEMYLLKSDTALAIYDTIKDLPIIDPHNHADVQEIADDKKYSSPWQLFAATDHYVWECLRKRGVPERFITGNAGAKEKWMRMAKVFPELAGNPVYEWIHLDLKRYLGIDTILGPETGEEIWEEAKAVLAVKTKRPQALLEQIGVEVMCSTDDPLDLLEDHQRVNKSFGRTIVRPTWRPDKAMNIFAPEWVKYIKQLEYRYNIRIESVADLMQVLRVSHDYFAEHGCVASDHGLEVPYGADIDYQSANKVFCKAMENKKLTHFECRTFVSYFLGEVAEMDAEKDWVFQMHIGAMRDKRDYLYETLGADSGGDVSSYFIDIMTPLTKFLNRFDDRLKVALYCLDPTHQATLATISRAFGQKVNLGAAWWLCDSPVGMRRQLEYIGSVDLLANFAGMVSDSRKLLSFGSRFEMFRRTIADILADHVDYGQIPQEVALQLARRICYDGPKEFYNL